MSTTQTVTVLFTDMVGSTALSSSLDPDAADRVRQEHFAGLRQALAATDGREVKNLGDGIMAVFASSSAAIACGVAMQQGVDASNRQSEHTLGLRVGLSGGEVTVEDEDYFGDPVVEAARVCALCEGGRILMTDAVRFMVGRRSAHPLTSLGEQELKGLPDPVALYEVGWEPNRSTAAVPLPERLESASATGFGFFGRVREREQLSDALKRVDEGSRQVAFLSGEPGIGKTSLCRHIAGQAHEQDVCVLYGRCDEDLGLSYQPFGEALSHLVVHADDALLAEHVADHGAALATLVPALSTRLPALPVLQSADPDTERGRLFSGVVGLLRTASTDASLLLVIDDLHWADAASLQLLRHVARSNQLGRVMILGTYRDSELAAGSALSDMLASLRRETDVQRIDLVGLEDFEIVEMMEAAAGHAMPDEGVALAHAVRQETEGNPFFTSELLVHLGEAGLVRQDEEGRWVATDHLHEQGLPQSVREVVGQRIDRLGDEIRQVLSLAAVIGRDFDVNVLSVVADLDEDRVLDLLDRATAAGLVTEVDSAVDRFSFAHALTQHTLYEDLGASRRARAHRRIGVALETFSADALEDRAGELAHHFLAATKTADAYKALTYAQLAGEQALARLAPADALDWFAQALDLAADAENDETRRCDLLIGLGIAQRQTGDPAHRETLLQAAAIAKTVGDSGRLVRAALANNRGGTSASGEVDAERIAVLEDALAALVEPESEDRALLLAIISAEMTFGEDRERAARLGAESLEMARRLHDPVAFLRVANVVYFMTYHDTLDDRLRDLADAVSIAATIGDPSASFRSNCNRMFACLQAGDLAGFDEHFHTCAVVADQLDQVFERWTVAAMRAEYCVVSGDLEAAEEHANAALEIGADSIPEALTTWGGQLLEIRDIQDRLSEFVDAIADTVAENPGLPVLRAALARVYCELDRNDEALALLEADLADRFAQFGHDPTWTLSMVLLADVCVQLRQVGVLPLLYEQLLPWHGQVAATGPAMRGPLALYLGMLAGALDDHAAAEQHFDEALTISEGLNAPYWAARTQFERAKMLCERGRTDDQARSASLIAGVREMAQARGFAALDRRAAELV